MTTELKRVKGWDGPVPWTYEGLRLAVLVEIRDELKALNRVMQCRNVARGFSALTRIAKRDESAFKRGGSGCRQEARRTAEGEAMTKPKRSDPWLWNYLHGNASSPSRAVTPKRKRAARRKGVKHG